jgi:hypothetical protein
VDRLAALVQARGFHLRPRLPVYPEYVARQEFFAPHVSKLLRERSDPDGFPLPVEPIRSIGRQSSYGD